MWRFLSCSERQLNLNIVLDCGQSFRWQKSSSDNNAWLGILSKRLWLLKQKPDGIYYQVVHDSSKKSSNENTDSEYENLLQKEIKDYFQLDVDIHELYKKWSKNDTNFNKVKNQFSGIRMLRQDPVENLFSFICSQNNNISRIKQLVEKLCINYGDFLVTYDGKDHYSFPCVPNLAKKGVEEELRKLSFGYRAKFIYGTAKFIEDKCDGEQWLRQLRQKKYEEAHKGLCLLPGVGAKVADCVCLMSLDKTEAIPVDTHIWQVAVRDYLPHLAKNKTMTDKTYNEIGDFFRELHGDYAGWANSVLFSADLRQFQDLKKEAMKVKSGSKRKSTSAKKTSISKPSATKGKKKSKMESSE